MSQTVDIRELNERIESKSSFVNMITMGMDKVIVGQKHLVESLLIGLLSDGHILLEGVPGLAKTLAIKTLSSLIDAKYSRIQFTPDLLPADVIGTMIYSQKSEEFQVKQGPIFANFVFSGRDQPCPGESTECLVGGHAGASGHDQRAYLQVAEAFLGNGYPEPDRAGGYVPVA